jgi:DNA-directed RNA polymerase subunit RPC12/RpoP
MAVQLNCPSCGASVKVRSGSSEIACQYCGNTVFIPTEEPVLTDETSTPSAVGKSCGRTIIIMVIVGVLLTAGVAALILFVSSSAVKNSDSIIAGISSLGRQDVVMEFGGTGTGPGYFEDPWCIALDGDGNIYVGEFETGRIQVFDSSGKFKDQWSFNGDDDVYLTAMSSSRDGLLYLVYNSEISIYNGETGELLGNLRHPDGWGFSDVDVFPDGSVIGAWYCNRDDLILFNSEGNMEYIIREAVSGQTGDSELSMMVAAGNMGETFVYGEFNSAVFLYNDQGRFEDKFGSEDVFTSPSGMEVDPMGRLWVSDFSELLLFNPTGELISRINPGVSIYDFVISDEMQLYGITYEDTIVQIDLSSY